MLRAFSLGIFDWSLAGHVAFLVVIGLIGARIASRRLDEWRNRQSWTPGTRLRSGTSNPHEGPRPPDAVHGDPRDPQRLRCARGACNLSDNIDPRPIG